MLPVAKRIKLEVPFGKNAVEGQNRGETATDGVWTVPDYYYWMRDDKRKNRDVLNHLEAENKYAESVMKDTKDLQTELFNEMKSRVKENNTSFQFMKPDGYKYYWRQEEGKSYKIYCRLKCNVDEEEEEEIILDVNRYAHENMLETCVIDKVSVNSNGNIMAFTVDTSGDEKYDIIFVDLFRKTVVGEIGYKPWTDYFVLTNRIKDVMFGDFEWGSSARPLDIYYTGHDEVNNRIDKAYVYNLLRNETRMIYNDDDPLFDVSLSKSLSGYLFVTSYSSDTTEVWFMDLKDTWSKLEMFRRRVEGVKYTLNHNHELGFMELTNSGGATNFKLLYYSKDKDTGEFYTPMRYIVKGEEFQLFQYDENRYTTEFHMFYDFIAILAMENGVQNLYIYRWQKDIHSLKKVEFPTTSHSITISYNAFYYAESLIFCYETWTEPEKVMSVDVGDGTMALTVLKEQKIPNYDSKLYSSKVIQVKSHDGVDIPMTLIWRDDKVEKRCFMFAYGAYSVNYDPYFKNSYVCLLDRGLLLACPHVRGSSMKGYGWYLDGKMRNKMNTFKDVVSCAEHLKSKGYEITLHGRSAGGLMAGGSMVMKPELFTNIVSNVPFVDVLNTMSDPTIPLTTGEWVEWGNPNNKEDFDYMKQYCPYYNIDRIATNKVSVPRILLTCGLHDCRVQYWEPHKFIAKMRHCFPDKAEQFLIKTEMAEGHFASSDRYKSLRESAFDYAFILKGDCISLLNPTKGDCISLLNPTL